MGETPPSPAGQRGESALRTELEQQLAEAMATRRALQALLAEQKRTEAALRASEALLNTTGEIARIGGWELDAATLAVRWTDQVYAIHEVPVGEVAVLAKAIDSS
jgi:GAF domain-containing protein